MNQGNMSKAEAMPMPKPLQVQPDLKQAGFVVLWRSLLEQSWTSNVYRLAAFMRLLSRAAHQERRVRYKSREWSLRRGQLVVNASELGLQLRDPNHRPMSRAQVKRILDGFKAMGLITIEGTPFGSVITICDYDQWQSPSVGSGLESAADATVTALADHPVVTASDRLSDQADHKVDMASAEGVDQPEITAGDQQGVVTTEQPLQPLDQDLDRQVSSGSSLTVDHGDADDWRTASWMAQRVVQIHQQQALPGKLPSPNLDKWAQTISRMRRLDHLSHHDICALFDWCCRDDFERANVRSPEKLRKRFPQLWLKAFAKTQPRSDVDDDADLSWMDGLLLPIAQGGMCS
ncbi:hypothetical protein [Celerinatantimonas sp. YJH-8]|uniref:hypothetical protein n=1 Tax=Celerinatantimonas sp. YJH-8 TaxID=3228714 RepID=UPI0038BF1DC6